MRICALTTNDNPYDYFSHFDDWFSFEAKNGFRCMNQLGRFAFTSDSLSYEENAREVERAIDEIIKYDVLGIYKKIVRDNVSS